MKRQLLALTFTAALLVATGCDDDPVRGCDVCPQSYQNLTQRSHVLNNLEVSYNLRNINKYSELLDQNFTMFFATGDFSTGKTPEQWGRQDELDANTNLFDPNYVDQDPSDGIQPRCTKIYMDVRWEDGVTWQEITPASAPGEKWYTATLYYNFQFDIDPDLHLINNSGSKAQLTVRNAGTTNAPRWQLVELRDLDL